jgi:hypothetical protein
MLMKARKNSKHELEFDGLCKITQVNDNGTVCFQKGTVNNVVNIRRIKPFHKQNTVPMLSHPSLIIGASAADPCCSEHT